MPYCPRRCTFRSWESPTSDLWPSEIIALPRRSVLGSWFHFEVHCKSKLTIWLKVVVCFVVILTSLAFAWTVTTAPDTRPMRRTQNKRPREQVDFMRRCLTKWITNWSVQMNQVRLKAIFNMLWKVRFEKFNIMFEFQTLKIENFNYIDRIMQGLCNSLNYYLWKLFLRLLKFSAGANERLSGMWLQWVTFVACRWCSARSWLLSEYIWIGHLVSLT